MLLLQGVADQTFQKPHPTFTRVDYDLHCTLELTLVEALCGWEKIITSICGKEIRFSHPGPTPATWRDDRAGLGMWTFKKPEVRGDLIAAVSIKYPGPLSETQKRMIRQALATGTSPRNSTTFF
jgi:DnaJ family protein B protein 4